MISVILPFFNAEKYLVEAINSVLKQSYDKWELLLINDGSTDKSKNIALSFKDSRIRYFEQNNKGVSSARNLGLANMAGDYFCFLDADDEFPINSIESRYNLFKTHPFLTFVDGAVKKFDHKMSQVTNEWIPSFIGEPLKDLVRLKGESFLGLTWMIKREKEKKYQFHENLTHSEDLLFFMELSRWGGQYAFTNEIILHYRNTPNSAMKNLQGLESGYRLIENQIKTWKEVNYYDLFVYKIKFRKAMFLAYLRDMKIFQAIKALL